MVNIGDLNEDEFKAEYEILAKKYNKNDTIKRNIFVSETSVTTKIEFRPTVRYEQHHNGGGPELGVFRNALKSIFGDTSTSHSHYEGDAYFTVIQPFYGDERDAVIGELVEKIEDILFLNAGISYEGDIKSLASLNKQLRKERDSYKSESDGYKSENEGLKAKLDSTGQRHKDTEKKYKILETKLENLNKEKQTLELRLTAESVSRTSSDQNLKNALEQISEYQSERNSLVSPTELTDLLSQLNNLDLSEFNRLEEYMKEKNDSIREYKSKLTELIDPECPEELYQSIKKKLEDDFFPEVKQSKDFWEHYGEEKEDLQARVKSLEEIVTRLDKYEKEFCLSKDDKKTFQKEVKSYVAKIDPNKSDDTEIASCYLEEVKKAGEEAKKQAKVIGVGVKKNKNGRTITRICNKIIDGNKIHDEINSLLLEAGFEQHQDMKVKDIRENIEKEYLEKKSFLAVGSSYTSLRKKFNRTRREMEGKDELFESTLELTKKVLEIKESLENLLNSKT